MAKYLPCIMLLYYHYIIIDVAGYCVSMFLINNVELFIFFLPHCVVENGTVTTSPTFR